MDGRSNNKVIVCASRNSILLTTSTHEKKNYTNKYKMTKANCKYAENVILGQSLSGFRSLSLSLYLDAENAESK